jgi:hypothetical protein
MTYTGLTALEILLLIISYLEFMNLLHISVEILRFNLIFLDSDMLDK